MTLRLVASRRCAADAPICGNVGEDADGRRWGWIAPHDASTSDISLPSNRLVGIPSTLSLDQAQAALSYWPAWHLSVLGGVGLGTRVLVSGGDWLARTVLTITRLRGRSWGASHASPDERLDADYRLRLEEPLTEALGRRRIPDPPDVVILTRPSPILAQLVALCRPGGSVVIAGDGWEPIDLGFYPDVHRRGLRLVFDGILSGLSSARDASHEFACLSRVVALIPSGELAECAG